MVIQQYGNRKPQLKRVLITGGGNSGKTTLASKFATSPDRIMFISTDGNAPRQGYKAIEFEYPDKAENMLNQFKKALDLAYTDLSNFDVIVWDLTEDADEKMQVLLRDEFNNMKTMLRAWGKINMFYKFAHTYMMSKFNDKVIVLLSRDVEEYDKQGEIKGYIPALRKVLKNIVLKDQDAEVRCYFEKGQRKFAIENLRFEEMRSELQNIINAKPIIPSAKPTQPPPSKPDDKPIHCEDCNDIVKDTAIGEKTYSSQALADYTKKQYGKVLCADCGARAKARNEGVE